MDAPPSREALSGLPCEGSCDRRPSAADAAAGVPAGVCFSTPGLIF